MKYINVRYILPIIAACILLASNCSPDSTQLSGGTTTETTNGYVTGSLEKIDGTPARQTIVKLLAANYDPVKGGSVPDSLIDTTGEAGEFTFHLAGGGTFNIEGIQRSSGEAILISGVTVNDSDTTTIPPDTIRKTGSIKIMLPPGRDTAGAYIYIRGTTICAILDDTACFALLQSVPAGIIPSVYYADTTGSVVPKSIADSVVVAPGATTVVVYQAWTHSAKLVLNTTASGADIAGMVTNFPVLIRLRKDNFDFAQANVDGNDLRFTKSNGDPLSYEIERWDPVSGLAEVWVGIDTVYGNDSTQSITMYWGASTPSPSTPSTGSGTSGAGGSASSESNGAAVFDTTSGFSAVWHLDTGCGDATDGNHGGTNFGATDTMGIIGGAKKFNGSSYLQVPGLLGKPQSITLSAWVHLDPTIIFSQDIVSLGDAVALRADRVAAPYYGTEGFFCSKVSASDSVFVFNNTGVFISKTGWRYLTYTVDGARHVQSMYIDGIFQCSTNDINPINYSGLGPNTFLGSHGNKKTQSYAIGCIDEARVCRVARSADWIKLCYMNQKQQDALVRW